MTTASDKLLRRLEWQVIRRLDGRLKGAHRTVWHGTGIDFTDLREYTPEDDVRHIDWNVTARLDEPYIRQYTEERDLTAWLVLDRSASMRFAASQHGKDSVLSELAVCLARMLSHGGNRVGAILYDNQDRLVVPPHTGRAHILRLAHEITKPVESGSKAITDLAGMMRLTASTARRRSLLFVLSDFIGDRGWERELAKLGYRHEVVVARIVDPVELDLPDLGLIVVEDAETGQQVLVDTSDPLLRQRLAAEVQSREDALAAAMDQAGVTAHRITTDQDLVRALVGMVRQSKLQSRGRRR